MGLPVGWEVAHEVYGVINPKVNATNPLASAPSCPKWPPTPLPPGYATPTATSTPCNILIARADGEQAAPQSFDSCIGGTPIVYNPTATPSATPAVTPNPGCIPSSILQQYNVCATGTWSAAEISMLEQAVQRIGSAFLAHFGGSSAPSAFGTVFYTATKNRITFDRIGGGDPYCTTNTNPAPPDLARITCAGTTLQLSAHTIVHEFGHAFVGRTAAGTPSYRARIETPGEDPNDPTGRILDENNDFVMGRRGVTYNGITYDDWARSQRFAPSGNIDNGWSSAAAFPGRCDGRQGHAFNPAAPPLFQQNACDVAPWLYATSPYNNTIQIIEVEEAAADMFLNWVYRRTSNGNGWSSPWEGFQNRLWETDGNGNICPAATGCPDPGNSGDARYGRMNQIMTELESQFGW
jgi:hypothetical protein